MLTRRFAVYCDLSGQIEEVICDDLQIQGIDSDGITLPALVASDSRNSCFEFLTQVRVESAVYGWTLNLRTTTDGTVLLHFAGVAHARRLLIVACDRAGGLLDFTEELTKINNQHVNDLRALMKRSVAARQSSAEVFTQITEMTNEASALQRELAKKKQELERLVAEKNELVGLAAHDLRNPLAGITLCASMFVDRDDLPADCLEIAKSMKAECIRMSSLLDDYLSVSAIHSGALRLSMSPTDLVALIREVVEKNELLYKKLRILFHSEDDFLPVTVDRLKIGQVLYNLLENAARHSPEDSEIQVSLSRDGGLAVIAIEDLGPGIRGEDWSLVLNSFQQGFRNVVKQGWGLGLAICQRIATAHGGEIRLSATPSDGARIELRIPLDEEACARDIACAS